MPRNHLLFPLFMLLTSPLLAQDEPAYIGIGFGFGAPMGDFRSTDVDNDGAGLATEGAVFDINFGYRMGKRFGVTAVLRGTGNATSDKAVSNSFNTPGLDIKVEPGTWVTTGLYVGGLGMFPMNERWSFSARALVGYASVTSPVLKVGTRDGYLFYKRESAVVGAPAYILGVGLKGDLGKRLCLLVNLDLMGAQATFDEVKTESWVTGAGKVSFTQSISLVTLAVGLGYRF
ncbi:MAG: hypothetical protein WAU70_02940 [Flavobacteriales bacterium]